MVNKTTIEETLSGFSGQIHCEDHKVTVFVNGKTKDSTIRSVEATYDKYHGIKYQGICDLQRYQEIEQTLSLV